MTREEGWFNDKAKKQHEDHEEWNKMIEKSMQVRRQGLHQG